jgi:DNA modification methylase
VLFKDEHGSDSEAQLKAFEDTWHWNLEAEQTYAEILTDTPTHIARTIEALRDLIGTNQMMAYLVMMTVRLVELHRVLKPTGSLYLHCDPTASHYLKIILDSIFGISQFRNEIIWRRTGAHSPRRSFGPIHDTLFFYTKTDDYYFDIAKRPYMRGHVERRYKADSQGRLKFTSGGNILTGSGVTNGESGAVWKGFNPSLKNRHWAIPGFLAKQMSPGFEKLGVLAKLDALYEAGLIEITEGNAWPVPVRYFQSDDGQPLQDIWAYQPYTEDTVNGTDRGIDNDVAWLGTTDPERLGYQTQKPLGLLDRIIKSSSPNNGIVLDPFCGCGTAVVAAQNLMRRWIGIDITHLGISTMKSRLKESFPGISFKIIGEPTDIGAARQLAAEDRYQFQWWALSLIHGAMPQGGQEGSREGKKGADKGIDGILSFIDDPSGKAKRALIQVKSGHVNSSMIRDLIGTTQRENAAIGVFITLEEPTRDMVTEAVTAGFYNSPGWRQRYPAIQIYTVDELLHNAEIKMPPRYWMGKRAKILKNFGEQKMLDLMPSIRHSRTKTVASERKEVA